MFVEGNENSESKSIEAESLQMAKCPRPRDAHLAQPRMCFVKQASRIAQRANIWIVASFGCFGPIGVNRRERLLVHVGAGRRLEVLAVERS